MSDTLIIHFLDRSATLVEWVHLDAAGKKIAGMPSANLTEIIVPVKPYDAYVFVPSTDVLLTTVDIPYTTQTRLLKAIPYALEEQLAEEVEELHFALANTTNHKSPLAVAVVNNKLMHYWITALTNVRIEPEAIIPDVFAVPYLEKSWCIFNENNISLIRQDYAHGFATDSGNVNKEIELSILENTQKPEKIVLLGKEKIEFNLEILAVHNLNVSSEAKLKTFMDFAIDAVNDIIPINLMQGKYRGKHRYLHLAQRWKWPLVLGSIWLFIFITGHIISIIYLKQKSKVLEQEIITLYQRIYPETKIPTQPRRELEHQINKLNRIAQGSRFSNLLDQTVLILHKLNINKIEQISFNQNELTLKISLENSAILERFIHELSAQGLSVKRNEVTSTGKQVNAELGIS